jgi:hypothetical protein
MPSALYLIGSSARSLDTFEHHVEPYLVKEGIQVPNKDIVPVSKDYPDGAILAGLAGRNVQDSFVREIISRLAQEALNTSGSIVSALESEGIISFICNESTNWQMILSDCKLECLASYSDDRTASELFLSRCLGYQIAYITPRVEDLAGKIRRLDRSVETLEGRVKKLAQTKLSETRQ